MPADVVERLYRVPSVVRERLALALLETAQASRREHERLDGDPRFERAAEYAAAKEELCRLLVALLTDRVAAD